MLLVIPDPEPEPVIISALREVLAREVAAMRFADAVAHLGEPRPCLIDGPPAG